MKPFSLREIGDLRIGQKVTRLSFDAGVPDEEMWIWGLRLTPQGGTDITLGAEDGTCQEDGLVRSDILSL